VEVATRSGRGRDTRRPRRDLRTVRSVDGHPRASWSGLAGQPGGDALARAEGAGRGDPAFDEPHHVTGGPGRIEPDIATDPPFQGLRRNAPALVVGLILVVGIGFFLPDLTPPPSQPSPVELLRGRILQLLPPSDDPTVPDVRILALDG